MKNLLFSMITLLSVTLITTNLKAQTDPMQVCDPACLTTNFVTKVKYFVKYNPEECTSNGYKWDFYIYIEEGCAASIPSRAQFNSQYSVVLPTGTSIIGQPVNYMPLQNNQTYTGTVPTKWAISDVVINPVSSPGNDFYSIVPGTNPASFYNNLCQGDSVRVFSLILSLTPNCGEGVRIFENGVDPDSSAPGMGGGDFSNGFTIGGSAQKYNGNLPKIDPPLPGIDATNLCSTDLGIDLNLFEYACQAPYTYTWTGPGGFTATTQDVMIPSATSANNGVYMVTVTDVMGCSSELSVNGEVKPDAGEDMVGCVAGSVQLQGSNPTSGTWSADPGNPIGATLTPGAAGAASVTFGNSAAGDYQFIYTNMMCSDTVVVSIGVIDAGSDPADVNCFSAGTASLNAVTPGGVWSVSLSSPGTAIIANPNSQSTTVSMFSAPGTYTLVYSVGGCFDEVMINVGNNCDCPITNNSLTAINPSAYCGSSGSILIDGSTAAPTGGSYQWQYSLNGGSFGTATGSSTNEDYTTADLSTGMHSFRRLYSLNTGLPCVDTSNVVFFTVSAMPPPPAGIMAVPSTICDNETTTISVTNTPGAVYTWSASSPNAGLGTSTTNSVVMNPTSPGSYVISVFQTINGCDSDPSTITVTVNAVPPTPSSATVMGNNPTSCAVDDGTITLSGLSNNTSYTINYNLNSVPQSASVTTSATGVATLMGLSGGTYSNFVVVSSDGCASAPFFGPILLTDPSTPDAPTGIMADPNPACLNEAVTITVDNTLGATYTWSGSANAGLSASTTNTVEMNALSAGLYVISVTQTIAGCVSSPTTIGVQVNNAPPTPSTATGINPSVCGGTDGAITISGLAASTTFAIQYSDNGVVVFDTLATNASGVLTIPNLGEGSYTNFSVTNSIGCTSGVFAGPVSLSEPGSPPAPSNIMANPNPACLGEMITVSVSPNPGATFNWTSSSPMAGLGSSTTNTITLNPTGIGTFMISVSQTVAGCTSPVSTVDITVQSTPPTPSSITPTNPSTCSGSDGSIVVAGYTPNVTYTLNYTVNGNATSMMLTANGAGTLTLSGLMAGSYGNFEVVSSAGCPSSVFVGPVTLVDPNAPPAPVGIMAAPSTFCLGETSTISVTNNPGATYTWSVAPSNPGLSTSTTNSVMFTPTVDGTFTITVFQTLAGCVSPNAQVVVNVTPNPPAPTVGTITSNDPSVCAGSDGSIMISGYVPSETYAIDYEINMAPVNVILTANGSGVLTISGLTSGTYSNFIVTNALGCSSAEFAGPINLVDPGSPSAPIGLTASPICLGESVTFNVTGEPGATYMWSASSANAGLMTSTTNSTSATPTVVGTYTISVTQTLAGCTSPAAMVTLQVFSVPVTPTSATVMGTNPSACGLSDGMIVLSNVMANSGYTITYSFNGNVVNMTVTSTNGGQIVISDLGSGTYTDFTLTNAANCSSGVFNGPIILTEPSAPPAPSNLTAQPNPICMTGTVNLSVDNTQGATYQWSASSPAAGLVTSSTNMTTMTATSPGNYVINVTQTVNGCTSPAATIEVIVLPLPITPSLGNLSKTDPSACGAEDGSISITGLLPNEQYTLYYSYNGVPLSAILTSNAQGVINLSSLLGGSYTDLQLENSDGCLSGVFAGPVALLEPGTPDAPSGLTASPNPVCKGETIDFGVNLTSGATYNWIINPQGGGDFVAGSGNTASFTGYTAGIYTVSVSQTIQGCTSPFSAIQVLVRSECLNPDFGVTYNGVSLTGDLSTNDGEAPGTTYGNPFPLSTNPSGCLPVIAADGSYTFSCNVVGEYEYTVEVCEPNQTPPCIRKPLVITVLDIDATNNPPVANLDYIYTNANNPVTIEILANDYCQSVPSCNLGTPTLVSGPFFGTFNPNTMVYTPNTNYVGVDSFLYSVCQSPATPVSCDQEWVYIEVYPSDADEFTNAMDDYNQTPINTLLTASLSDGVKWNDSDPQGKPQVVNPQSSSVGGKGDIILNADGSYTFTPAFNYIGPVDFAYQVCRGDNSAICDSATLHILVAPQEAAGSVSSCAWHDRNGNGLFDNGEPGIPNVTVNIYTTNGMLLASTTTNSAGNYTLSDVPVGNYYLEFLAPDNWDITFPNVGSNENIDSDVDDSEGYNTTAIFGVDPGVTVTNVKAGYYECAKIGDNVWYDFNKNDIYDPTENGINGIKVYLFRKVNGVFVQFDVTTTGLRPGTQSSDGYWMFCAPPGEYYIKIDLPPSGLVLALPNVGNNELLDSDINGANGPGTTSSFTLPSGGSKLDIGAGYYPQAMVGNLVWFDENFDGIQNPTESKVANVLVEAIEVETGELLGSSVTNQNGEYIIDNLRKKNVYFKFYPPSGMVATVSDIGYDNIDSDVDNTFGENTTKAYMMVPETVNETVDFGVALGALPVTWVDVSVVQKDNDHLLSWTVEQEVNVDRYEVEYRHESASSFTLVEGAAVISNNVASRSTYSYIHEGLIDAGQYYYRVKQYDIDGKFNFSKIVTINRKFDFDARVYPNPSNADAYVEFNSTEELTTVIQIINNAGAVVSTQSFETGEGFNRLKLDLSSIPSGAYGIVIENGDRIIRKKLIRIQ